MKLGDSFPEGHRREFVSQRFVPGVVLYLPCSFTTPPKEKYTALVCVAPALAFVVNSSVNAFVSARPELSRCQVRLDACDYDFLKHDSFLDCSNVIEDLDSADIREQLVADTGRVKGRLTSGTAARVIEVVETAKTISGAHKRLIGNALRSSYG